MGRKKIEIRPLTDERNRNVTFLKRKAGLMKKAWELSVLCAADVSIVIFSAAGKAYEFSSKELESEIERYHDYEGMIERRRAPEFEAMALAGEDDDDDDDDVRPSKGKNAQLPVVNKSLKGKEIFKARSGGGGGGTKTKTKGKSRRRDSSPEIKPSFIDGILSDQSRTDSDSPDDRDTRRERDESEDDEPSGKGVNGAGLQYAFELMSQNTRGRDQRDRPVYGSSSSIYPTPLPPSLPPPTDVWNHRQSYPPTNALEFQQPPAMPYPYAQANQFYPPQHQALPQLQQSYPPVLPPTSAAPLLPSNMQWDANLLARYAEFQLQQNHQRQQRALLDRQRQQLAELGVPLEDKSLLDELFGASGSGTRADNGNGNGSNGYAGIDMSALAGLPRLEDKRPSGDDTFIWPTFSNTNNSSSGQGSMGMLNSLAASGSNGRMQQSEREGDDLNWMMDGGDDMVDRGQPHLPSPASAGKEDRYAKAHVHTKGKGDKRDRDRDDRRRDDKRSRVDEGVY